MTYTDSRVAEIVAEVQADGARHAQEAEARAAATFEAEATALGLSVVQHREQLAAVDKAVAKAQAEAVLAAKVQSRIDATDPAKVTAAILQRRRW